MTVFNESDFLGLHCRAATGKATAVGLDNDTSRKELGGSAGVKLPWT